MTQEQYESLPLNELRAVAKARGLKKISSLRKRDLIERMLEADREDEAAASAGKAEGPENLSNPAEEMSAVSDLPEKEPEKPDAKEEQTRSRSADRNFRQKGRNQTSDHGIGSHSGNEKSPARNPMRNRSAVPDGSARQKERTEAARVKTDVQELDSGNEAHGILEVLAEGYGFIRSENFLPGDDDVYVSPSQIRKFGLKTGDMLYGNTRIKSANEKFSALLYIKDVNGMNPASCQRRMHFENMTPVFPNERIHLERSGGSMAMRIVDLISPIGKGQRGMIVSPPKAGKTTLLKETAMSILQNNPEMHLIILLIDERPEEVTDIKETVRGSNVEVIYSTFDELPEHHKRVSEMVIERAKRLVENHQDVMIFIDSITRLARAYNQVVPPSGRTLSGGLDPAALHMPKRFFGAARNMREGGSLTILATALVDTGSKMDDVVYEEFKGTGNMELVLDRKLQERRVFPAIDIVRSGTRKEDLLLTKDELDAVNIMRRSLNRMKTEEAAENILDLFAHTRNNAELVRMINRRKMI
ncbi:MAG: transcription termination factor Rho [Bilifractor sp.]